MRYALVIDHEPILYASALHRFLQRAAGRIDCVIVGTGIQSPARKKAYARAVWGIYGARHLLTMVWRYARGPFWSLDRVARHHGVPMFRCSSVNSPELRALLVERGITTVLSTTAEIYKKDTLRLPGVKLYNFHGSLLPGHKGLLPIFWACMNGDRQGITLHEIVEKIDEGAIVFQAPIEGAKDESVAAFTDAMLEAFPDYLVRALDHLDAGLAPVLLNEGIRPSYEPIPSDEDIRVYTRRRARRQVASGPGSSSGRT